LKVTSINSISLIKMELEDQLALMRGLQIFVAILSLIGEILIILAYIALIELKTFRMKLIVCLGGANLVATISDLMIFYNDEPGICVLEGFLRTYGELSAVMWVVVISRVSYKEVLEPFIDREFLFKRYLVLAIWFPAVIALM